MSQSDDDELVATGRAPRWLRWAAWSLAGVVAAVLVTVVVRRHDGSPTAEPRPSRAVASSRVASPNGNNRPTPPHTAVARAGDVRWEVQGTTLYVETAVGPGHYARVITLPPAFAAPAGETCVAVDPVTGDAWVVLANRRPSVMIQVSRSLAQIVRRMQWATQVSSAAAYAGHLYLSTDNGIADLAPQAEQPHRVPGLSGTAGSVVADPARHRLIATHGGYPTWLWTFGPHVAAAQSPEPLAIGEAMATVVNGAIWVRGRAGTAAVLERLDPNTLRPTTRLLPPAHLNARAVPARR